MTSLRARIAFVLVVSIVAVVALAVAVLVLGPRGPNGFVRSVATQIEMLIPHLTGVAQESGARPLALLHDPAAGAPRQQLTRMFEDVLREAGIPNRVVVTRRKDMPMAVVSVELPDGWFTLPVPDVRPPADLGSPSAADEPHRHRCAGNRAQRGSPHRPPACASGSRRRLDCAARRNVGDSGNWTGGSEGNRPRAAANLSQPAVLRFKAAVARCHGRLRIKIAGNRKRERCHEPGFDALAMARPTNRPEEGSIRLSMAILGDCNVRGLDRRLPERPQAAPRNDVMHRIEPNSRAVSWRLPCRPVPAP
jgi:hypothetical protein